MAPLCLFYFAAVATCLGAAGVLFERALPASVPRRLVWGAVMALSLVLPIVISAQHSAPMIEVLGYRLVVLPAAPMHAMASHGMTPRATLLQNLLECSAAYGQTILQVWGIATLVLLAWGLAGALRISRRPGRSSVRLGADHGVSIVDGVRVTVTESVGPATVGFWRSRVVVPRWVLTLPLAQRRYVLRHEEEHRRAHDARLLCVASILVCLFPFNPALWWQFRRLRLAIEMDCDQRVVSALGGAPAYGELLLGVARAASRAPRLQPAFLGHAGMLERRLIALVRPARRERAMSVGATLVAGALLLLVLVVPHPGRAPEPDGASAHRAAATAHVGRVAHGAPVVPAHASRQ